MSEADFTRRLGTFSLSTKLIELDPDAVIKMLQGCIVIRAEVLWHREAITYVALHKDFDVVTPGQIEPTYVALITYDEAGFHTMHWRRIEGSAT